MDYSELLKAFLMNQAAHTQGHMQNAYSAGMVPAHVDWSQGIEVVPEWVSNPRTDQQRIAATKWQGAGFEGQQDMGKQLLGSGMEQEYALAQGISKLLYPILAPMVSKSLGEGDIENIERFSGNKATAPLLGVSALSDLYQAYNPGSRFSADFITPQGAPGLKLNWRF